MKKIIVNRLTLTILKGKFLSNPIQFKWPVEPAKNKEGNNQLNNLPNSPKVHWDCLQLHCDLQLVSSIGNDWLTDFANSGLISTSVFRMVSSLMASLTHTHRTAQLSSLALVIHCACSTSL